MVISSPMDDGVPARKHPFPQTGLAQGVRISQEKAKNLSSQGFGGAPLRLSAFIHSGKHLHPLPSDVSLSRIFHPIVRGDAVMRPRRLRAGGA